MLKVLEEYRVPIDCIAGTSMGALIGAGYASGMTVAEMTAMIEQLSFDVLFKEQPPREERSIRRKQEESRNLFGPQIGVGDDLDLRFQKGIVSGVRLELLEGLYAGVSAEVGDYGKPLLAGNPSGALYSGSAFPCARQSDRSGVSRFWRRLARKPERVLVPRAALMLSVRR